MRKGVVGKRNNKLEKLKRKINTMLSGWEKVSLRKEIKNLKRKINTMLSGWEKVSLRKEIKNLEKIKGKKIESGGDGGKGVVENRNKKIRKIKIVKIRCYVLKKSMSSKSK